MLVWATPAGRALGLDEINRQVPQGVREVLAQADEDAAVGVPLPLSDALPFAQDGPLWYRGDSLENERIVRDRLQRVLELLDARVIVVAHTPTGSGRITSRQDQGA